MIGGGFRRYGFAAEAARVARGLFDVAERQVAYRLPELFAGLPRREASFPVQYLGANVPQAWAAGSILRLIAVLAGIHATSDRDGSRLYVNPALPDWPAGADDPQLAWARTIHVAVRDGTVEVSSNTSSFEVIHGPAPQPGPAWAESANSAPELLCRFNAKAVTVPHERRVGAHAGTTVVPKLRPPCT